MAPVMSVIARGTRPHLSSLAARHSTRASIAPYLSSLQSSSTSPRICYNHCQTSSAKYGTASSKVPTRQIFERIKRPTNPLESSHAQSRHFSQLWRKLQAHSDNSSSPSKIPQTASSSAPSETQQHAQQTKTTIPQPNLATPTRHENIYTIPNFLTATRFFAAPAIGYFIMHQNPYIAFSLFLYAGITDAIDGYIARHFSSTTVLGTILDPAADKLLMTITVSTLALSAPTLMPWWLAVIILGRDVGLALSALWWRWISLPEPKTMRRYWDFSLPSAEVRPTEISKINTLLQLCYVGGAMVLPVLPEAVVAAWNLGGVLQGWGYLVATTTVWSGLSYVFTKDAVRVLSKEEVRRVEEKRAAK